MPNDSKSWNLLLIFIAVFVLSWALRIYKVPSYIISGDSALTPCFTVDSFPDEWSLGSLTQTNQRAAGNPLRFGAYYYGALHPMLMWISGALFSVFSLTINEFTWLVPVLTMGALTPILVFLFLDRISTRRAAWIGLVFFMVMPIHMIQSRCYNPSIVQAFFMQILVVWSFLKYLDDKRRRSALIAGFTLAIYIHTHLQWPPMGLLLMAIISLCDQDSKTSWHRIRTLFKTMLRWDFAIFPLSAIASLFIIYVTIGGPIKHILYKGGGGALGFYVVDWVRMTIENNGIFAAPILVLAFGHGLYLTVKKEKTALLFYWACIYSLAFWFWADRNTTITSGYLSYGMFAFAMGCAVFLGTIKYKTTALVSAVILSLGLLYSGTAKCYQWNLPFSYYKEGYLHNTWRPDAGFKAAGFWIRQHAAKNEQVFSFAINGDGMEGEVCNYYLDRLVYVRDDSFADAQRAYFSSVEAQVTYVIVESKDFGPWKESIHSDQFHPIVEIRNQDQTLLYILKKGQKQVPPEILNVEHANQMFDETYGHIRDLHGSQKISLRDGPLPDTKLD